MTTPGRLDALSEFVDCLRDVGGPDAPLGALMNLRGPEAVGWISVVVANTSARVGHAPAMS